MTQDPEKPKIPERQKNLLERLLAWIIRGNQEARKKGESPGNC